MNHGVPTPPVLVSTPSAERCMALWVLLCMPWETALCHRLFPSVEDSQCKWNSHLQFRALVLNTQGKTRARSPVVPSCHMKAGRGKSRVSFTTGWLSQCSPAPTHLPFFFFFAIYIFHSFTRDVNLSLISSSLVCVGGMNSICFCSTLSDTAAIRLNDNCGPNNKNTI